LLALVFSLEETHDVTVLTQGEHPLVTNGDHQVRTRAWPEAGRTESRGRKEVREGGFEPPRPFGHRILRLLLPGTDSPSTCPLVSSGVVPYHPASLRREQDVSKRSLPGTSSRVSIHPPVGTGAIWNKASPLVSRAAS
jgi:hypothetical protein